jgi:hypothetical protein
MTATSVFELRPTSREDGSLTAAWFDDAASLWNDRRLRQPESLLSSWQTPRLQLYRPESGPTAVLFNPNAYAVSEGLRDALSRFHELEFLPVEIESFGIYFVLHVTQAIELPEGCKVRRAPAPSGNIVTIESFPTTYEPQTAFFRILHPEGSAARRAGSACKAIFANRAGADAINSSAGFHLCAAEVKVSQ